MAEFDTIIKDCLIIDGTRVPRSPPISFIYLSPATGAGEAGPRTY